MKPEFNEELQCFAVEISYDYESTVGKLHIVDGGCCDMRGAIRFFSRLDRNVTVILSFTDEFPDTAYEQIQRGSLDAKDWAVYTSGDARWLELLQRETARHDMRLKDMRERNAAFALTVDRIKAGDLSGPIN